MMRVVANEEGPIIAPIINPVAGVSSLVPPCPFLFVEPFDEKLGVLGIKIPSPQPQHPPPRDLKLVWKLLLGSLGIYMAFLYHGNLEEDLFLYRSSDGRMFRYVWLLQVFECLSAFGVGITGRGLSHTSSSHSMGWNMAPRFWLPGASQVISKALTGQALAAGLSFPVVVLAKSAKIVPVMCGQLALGGAQYETRDYFFVALVVGGTILLTAGGESSHHDGGSSGNRSSSMPSSSWIGVLCIFGSLCMDGITAGLQKRIQNVTQPNVYDFLTFTNIAMVIIAFTTSVLTSEWEDGIDFLSQNPRCVSILFRCCLCSAIGQSFIFFIIATFDPLVLSTITTTRKILSVLLSILLKGHLLTRQGVTGLSMAVTGLLIEIEGKLAKRKTHQKRLPAR